METVLDKVIERFYQDDTIELTLEEELIIVDSLIPENDYIACGSSRAVYQLGDKYVVKIAMSTGGINQNKVERDFYAEHKESGCFAHLYAYGKMINVMELLEDCEYHDADDVEYYAQEEAERGDCDFYCILADLIGSANYLTNYYGGDNGQIGYSPMSKSWVLYDYGYSMDYDRDDIVDNVDYWIYAICPVENALEVLNGGEVKTPDELQDMAEAYFDGKE